MEKLKKELEEKTDKELIKMQNDPKTPAVNKAAIKAVLKGREKAATIDNQNKELEKEEGEAKSKATATKDEPKNDKPKAEKTADQPKAEPKAKKESTPKKKTIVTHCAEQLLKKGANLEDITKRLVKLLPDEAEDYIGKRCSVFFKDVEKFAQFSDDGCIIVSADKTSLTVTTAKKSDLFKSKDLKKGVIVCCVIEMFNGKKTVQAIGEAVAKTFPDKELEQITASAAVMVQVLRRVVKATGAESIIITLSDGKLSIAIK